MMPSSKLVLAATLPIASAARAQATPPSLDTLAERGRRDGRAAAEDRRVGGTFAAGLAAGFIGGLVGIPLIAGGEGGQKAVGSVAFGPIVWAVAVAADRRRAHPPAHVTELVERESADYRAGFRVAYSERLTARRTSAVVAGTILGTVAGLAAFAALALAALGGAAT